MPRYLTANIATRPIFHQCDATIRGHVFCSFLALVLRKELQDRLAAAGHSFEWAEVLRDLDRLQEVEVEQDHKRFVLRTPVTGCAGLARAVLRDQHDRPPPERLLRWTANAAKVLCFRPARVA